MARGPGPGEPVHGPSWRRDGERRLRAARIARQLRPVTHVLGGLVSIELTVRCRGRWYRPDVGVLLGAPPPQDGVLTRAPMLVVCLGGPLTAAAWLGAGAGAVWACDPDGVIRQLSRTDRRVLARDEWLTHPAEPALRLPAAELRPASVDDARISA